MYNAKIEKISYLFIIEHLYSYGECQKFEFTK